MAHILQTVTGSEMMSMLDGFSGYNRISVAAKDQHKMTFTTPWDTFAYSCMPFRLINVGTTFQRAINSSFSHLLDKVIVIYLDDMTIFSRRRKKHLRDMRRVLQRSREHVSSLNSKKFMFCDTEG